MNEYIYSGPVTEYGKVVMNQFEATTMAVSEAKAKSNLAYQYKKKYNRTKTAKVGLPGKLVIN